ncbi:MAG: O-antigen ligase family protein [Bradyrhizobium sp.]
MSFGAAAPPASAQPFWRDRARWTTGADVLAILAALTLPWSTSLPGIFVPCFLVAVAAVMDWRAFGRLLKDPICYLPLALAALAAIGMLWSDASWAERFRGLSPLLKLLVLPALFYHFERSSRGMWVLIAFLVSCVLLMIMSWLVVFYPGLSLKPPDSVGADRGIFVKNYIAQSQEFALCAVALAYPIIRLLQSGRTRQALALGAISFGFIVNMAFVIVSRTAMVTMPIMIVVFALLHLKWRARLLIAGGLVIVTALAFATSPQLQQTLKTFSQDYQRYSTENAATSAGLRIEFWKKSLHFFAEAPVIGHGTGSTRGLFERAATGEATSASGKVINNPHNQTLNVAVQWGVAGVLLLYAMWWAHLQLFRGEGLVAWIGMLVVVQNIFTSLFNSHISDFHEGWMYVLGAGVAGGMAIRARSRPDAREPP